MQAEIEELDARIRLLCARIVKADDHEILIILRELRTAIHEHTTRVRQFAVTTVERTFNPAELDTLSKASKKGSAPSRKRGRPWHLITSRPNL